MSLLTEEFEEQEARSLSDIMFGRYMLPDRTEFTCQVRDLSPERATFSCDETPMLGEHIIAYIAEIGRVEGEVSETYGKSFSLNFSIPSSKRDKIAAKLNWMQNRDEQGLEDQRRHARHEPKNSNSVLTLPDGRTFDVEILDISMSGAAIKAPVIPSIGTQVTLGETRATVTRTHECGVGIEFSQELEEPDLKDQIT